MGLVEERKKKFEGATPTKDAKKEYFGEADVFEGTKINLRANFKGKQPDQDDAEWLVKDGSKDSDPPPIKIKLSQKTTEVYTFGPVADDKAKYELTYKLKFNDSGRDQELKGSCDFTVWPKSLHITAKYKEGDKHPTLANGDLVKGFTFKVKGKGGVVSPPVVTDEKGICEPQLIEGFEGVTKIVPVSPWEIIEPAEQKDEDPRKRELQVSLKPWKAKILNLNGGKTADAPIKQVVNADDGKGSLVKFEVGPEDLTLAKKDQEVKVRVTFDKDNCKRTEPMPALQEGEDKATKVTATDGADAKPGDGKELKYEKVLKVPDDGKAIVFYVQLGVCGGDKCKVEVGVTDTYEDDQANFQNLRRIGLEMLVPQKADRQACSDLLSDTKAELGAKMVANLNKIFKDTFTEFYFPPAGCKNFDKTKVTKYLKGTGNGFVEGNIAKVGNLYVAADKFCEPKRKANGYWDLQGEDPNQTLPKQALGGGDKVFLCSDYQRRYLRETVLPGVVKDKDTMTWVWMDFIASRHGPGNVFPSTAPHGYDNWKSDWSEVWNFFITSFEGRSTKKYVTSFHVFDYDPITASDTLSFKQVAWKASRYRKVGDADWIDIGKVFAKCPCPACVELDAKGKPLKHVAPRPNPGTPYKNYTWIPAFASKADVDKWVTITDSHNVTLKLPKKNSLVDPLPGDVVKIKINEDHVKAGGDGTETEQKEVEYELDITIQMEVYGVKFTTLGGAVNGEGDLQTGGGKTPAEAMANVFAHEIIHNCGHTYVPADTGANPRVGGRKANRIKGYPIDEYGKMVPDGPYYMAHGHQGSHCAKGVFDKVPASDRTKYLVKNPAAAKEVDYLSPTDDERNKYFGKVKDEDHCTMWGAADSSATKLRKLCDKCTELVRVTDVKDVTQNW